MVERSDTTGHGRKIVTHPGGMPETQSVRTTSVRNGLFGPAPIEFGNRNPLSKWATQMEVLRAYAITFGWALVGSVSMGVGIIIALKMFDLSTRDVDEWSLIKQGNIAMAIIIAAVILSLGIVVSSAIRP